MGAETRASRCVTSWTRHLSIAESTLEKKTRAEEENVSKGPSSGGQEGASREREEVQAVFRGRLESRADAPRRETRTRQPRRCWARDGGCYSPATTRSDSQRQIRGAVLTEESPPRTLATMAASEWAALLSRSPTFSSTLGSRGGGGHCCCLLLLLWTRGKKWPPSSSVQRYGLEGGTSTLTDCLLGIHVLHNCTPQNQRYYSERKELTT